MKRSKFLSLLLTFAMLLSMAVPAFAAEETKPAEPAAETTEASENTVKTFPDIADHWGKSSIERWAGYGVLNGDQNGAFNPNAQMTRAEFATMLVNLMGYSTKAENTFGDVKDTDWYADAVLKLAAAGIMKGDGVNANPNSAISRQEAAVLLCRAMDIQAGKDAKVDFADAADVASWAQDAVAALTERGMIAGVGENKFAPLDNITRASVAKMVDNMVAVYVAEDQEITGEVKGLVIVAADADVTVKGATLSENLIVAPKAGGASVALDAKSTATKILVSAPKAALEVAGKASAVVIDAAASETVVTIAKGGTVADLQTAADKVAVKGEGKLTLMTVTDGQDVTVAKSVSAAKIVNDSTYTVLYGDKKIEPGKTYTGSTGGGGGGSTGGNGGHDPALPDGTPATVDTVAKFLEEAQKAVKTVDVTVKNESVAAFNAADLAITNDSATTITVNFDAATVGNVTINAKNATTVTLKGTTGSLASLTINTPKADFNCEIAVTGDLKVIAVKPDTLTIKSTVGSVTMVGAGRVVVDESATVTGGITVDTAAPVTLSGKVGNVTATEAANITVSALTASAAPVIDSQVAETQLTVADASKTVAVKGDLDTVTVTAEGATVDAQAGAVVANVAVKAPATVQGTGLVRTVTAEEAVTLDTDVERVTVPATAADVSVEVKAGKSVDVLETNASVAVAGTGSVGSVDVKGDKAVTVKVADDSNVGQITKEPGTPEVTVDTNKGGLDVKTKAAPPALSAFTFTPVSKPGGVGTVTGVTKDMEYIISGENAEWTKGTSAVIKVAGDKTIDIRVAESGEGASYVQPSDSVSYYFAPAVAVENAWIEGAPIVGQTLTAEFDGDEVGMVYQWYVSKESAYGKIDGATARTFTVTDAQVGETIKVEVTNYKDDVDDTTKLPKHTATSDPTEKVSASMSPIFDLFDKVSDLLASANVKENDPKPETVPAGIEYWCATDAKALTDARDKIGTAMEEPMTTAQVSAAVKTLEDALAKFQDAKKTGTQTATVDNLTKELTAMLRQADELKVDSSADGMDVSPEEKWVTETVNAALADAVKTADTAGKDDKATVDTLTKAVNDLKKAMDAYIAAAQYGAPLDFAPVDAAIQAANDALASAQVSTDGSDVYPDAKWVTDVVAKALNDAITAANTGFAAAKTQKDVLKLVPTLNEAVKTFHAAKQSGTKDDRAPMVTGVAAARISATEATVVFNTNESGTYKYWAVVVTDPAGNVEIPDDPTGTGTISAAGKVTIPVTVVDGSAYKVFVDVLDATGNKYSFNVDIGKTPIGVDTKDVSAAILADTRTEGKLETLYTQDSYKAEASLALDMNYDVSVAISAADLRYHQNGGDPTRMGFWVGFALTAPNDAAKVSYAWGDSMSAIAKVGAAVDLEKNVAAGNKSGIAFYVDAATATKLYVAVQWVKADGTAVNAAPITYKMDLSRVQMKHWDVTFDTDSTAGDKPVSVLDGALVTKPADPKKDGYEFKGWFTSNDYKTEFDFAKTAITDTTTIYAQFAPVTYKITYVLDGGTNDTKNPATYTVETDAITLVAPTKAGAIFDGWYDNKDRTGTPVTEIAKGSTGDKTFYAKWSGGAAKLGDTVYKTLANAIEAVNAATAPGTGTLTILEDVGSDKDYGVYTISKPVTIKGENHKVYGSFVVTADGVTFDNLDIYNQGDKDGGVHRNGINAYVKNITVTNCDFVSGNEFANGLMILPSDTTVTYTIKDNTFTGYKVELKGWSTTAILITCHYPMSSKSFFEATADYSAATINMDNAKDLAIINGNTFVECKNDYTRNTLDDAQKATIQCTANSYTDNFRLSSGAKGSMFYVTGDVTRASDTEVLKETTLTVAQGKTLTVGKDVILTVSGKLVGDVVGTDATSILVKDGKPTMWVDGEWVAPATLTAVKLDETDTHVTYTLKNGEDNFLIGMDTVTAISKATDKGIVRYELWVTGGKPTDEDHNVEMTEKAGSEPNHNNGWTLKRETNTTWYFWTKEGAVYTVSVEVPAKAAEPAVTPSSLETDAAAEPSEITEPTEEEPVIVEDEAPIEDEVPTEVEAPVDPAE